MMDAQHLGFRDGFFDAVVAQYVITTVPDPGRRSTSLPASPRRAARSSWSIISAPRAGPRRVFEQSFAPLARRLGWRSEFRWQRLAQWAEHHGGVRLIERRPMPPLGHFSLIRFARLPAGGDGRRGADGGRGGWQIRSVRPAYDAFAASTRFSRRCARAPLPR